MKKIIAGLLIWTQVAFAGKLQDADFKTEAQLISAGATASSLLNDTKIYVTANGLNKKLSSAIEAGDIGGGSSGILSNGGFESGTTGWTSSGGATATTNATAKGTGALGYDWDSNAASQTLMSTSVTIPNGLQSKNGVASCQIKTVSGTATHTIVVNDGTNDIGTPLTIGSNTAAFQETKINFVFPSSGTIRLKLASVNANEPELLIDDCKISLADNIFDAPLVTAWETYTPTFTGFGTATNIECKSRRNGENREIDCKFTSGTSTATEARVSLPNSITTSGSDKIPSLRVCGDSRKSGVTTTDFGIRSPLCAASLTYITFGKSTSTTAPFASANGSDLVSNGEVFQFYSSVPISGYTAVSAVSADQTDYDWAAYTPTFTGFGTVSVSAFFHKRIGDTLYVRGKFTSGTTTATEARVSLPNSLITANSALIPSLTMAGSYVRGGHASISAHGGSVLMDSSLGYVTFEDSEVFGSGSTQTQANRNADTEFSASGDIISMNFSVPISTFKGNQRAPTLVGSVTSNSAGAERIERVKVGTASCTSSPCTIASGSSGISVTRQNTGKYNLNFTIGFSATPTCSCVSHDYGVQATVCSGPNNSVTPSTTQWGFETRTITNVLADSSFDIICMGPR